MSDNKPLPQLMLAQYFVSTKLGVTRPQWFHDVTRQISLKLYLKLSVILIFENDINPIYISHAKWPFKSDIDMLLPALKHINRGVWIADKIHFKNKDFLSALWLSDCFCCHPIWSQFACNLGHRPFSSGQVGHTVQHYFQHCRRFRNHSGPHNYPYLSQTSLDTWILHHTNHKQCYNKSNMGR